MSLDLEGVRVAFGAREVIKGVDLSVRAGEIFALVGPSGAGKTTLLRCSAFLQPMTQGHIWYGGRGTPTDEAARLALRRNIGMVAQNPFLFRGTVAYNVSYGLCVRGIEGPELLERTAKAIERLGLGHLGQTPVAGLSAGEAQRVAFARATVVRPDLLLLDEFTANLDPANVKALEAAIREVNRTMGTTIVIVTHNLFQAKRLAQRVGLLLDGRLIEVAATRDFFENPSDPRTRGFVDGEFAY